MTKPTDVSEIVGKFGRYHFILIVVNILRAIPIGWTLSSVDFLAGDVDHSCAAPVQYNGSSWTDDGVIETNVCNRFFVADDGSVNKSVIVPCTSWSYNMSQPSSAVVEWDLVCERSYMRSMIQSVVFIGQLTGALIFGKLADRYGRLIMFDVAAVSMLLFGVGASFVPYVHMFNAVRFVQAMSTAGMQILSAALYSEVALPSDRNYLHLGMTLGLGITQVVLPGMAKWLDNWRYVQLATGLIAASLVPFLFLMQESPRWLLASGKQKEAKKSLSKILKMNGKPTDEIESFLLLGQSSQKPTQNLGLAELWPFKNVRRNLLLLFLVWSINSITLFGMTFLPTKIKGDRFVNFAVVSSAEPISGLIGLWVIRKFRRRFSMTFLYSLCSVSCVAVAVIPIDYIYARLAGVFLARFCVVITTAVMWIYTMELLPTSVRGFGLSLCFFFGRASASSAPFLRDLAEWHNPAPFFVVAGTVGLGAIIARVLPETLGRPLPDTLDEANRIAQKKIPADLPIVVEEKA